MHYTSVLRAEKPPASTTGTETSERPVKKSHFFYIFYMFSLQNCEKHLKIIAVKHRHTEMSFEGISHGYCLVEINCPYLLSFLTVKMISVVTNHLIPKQMTYILFERSTVLV